MENMRIIKKFPPGVKEEIENRINQPIDDVTKVIYAGVLYFGDSDDYTSNMFSRSIQPMYDYLKEKINIPSESEQDYRNKIITVIGEVVKIKENKKLR